MTNGSSDDGEENYYDADVAPSNNNNNQTYNIPQGGGTLSMRTPQNSKKRRREDDEDDNDNDNDNTTAPDQNNNDDNNNTPEEEQTPHQQPPEKKQRKKADHTGGPWTSEQDAYLERLIKEGHKVLQIQNMFEDKFHLGRSRDAVRNRVKRVRAKTMELSEEEEKLIKEEIRFVQDPNNLSRIVLDRIKLLVPNATQGLIDRYMKDDKDVQLAVALDGFRKGKISRAMKEHMKIVMGDDVKSPGQKKGKKAGAVPAVSIEGGAGEGTG